MSLETTIADITARLRHGKFPNEQAVSQGIVLRCLQELGRDTWDTASATRTFRRNKAHRPAQHSTT